MRGGFRGSAGEAVACGTREWRLVGVSAERLGEDAAKGLPEWDAFHSRTNAGEFGGARGDQRGGFVKARQEGTGKLGAGQFGTAASRTHGRGLMEWIVEGSRCGVLLLRGRTGRARAWRGCAGRS